MSRKPIVSVIVEMGTCEVSKTIAAEKAVRFYAKEVLRDFTESESEIYFIGANLPRGLKVPGNCRFLEIPGTGYYGWKNKGAKVSQGRFVAFWDSDCRPSRGYLKRAVELLKKNPSWFGLTGLSRYSGENFWSRLDRTVNYGYLYQGSPTVSGPNAASHNMVIRRDRFPAEPFGPYDGRTGGDLFLCQFAKRKGHPLAIDPTIVVSHEPQHLFFSVKNYLDRHLRELFQGMLHYPSRSKRLAVVAGLKALLLSPVKRFWKILKYRKKMGFGLGETILAVPVILFYGLLDTLILAALFVWPVFLEKWLRFQFGKAGFTAPPFEKVISGALSLSQKGA